jgi:hypothetical protein
MKKVAFFLLITLSLTSFSQMSYYADITHTLTAGSADTLYYELGLMTSDNPKFVGFDFTGLSNNSAQLIIEYVIIQAGVDTLPVTASNLDTYPITLDKSVSTYKKRWNGKTYYTYGLDVSNWKASTLGYILIRNSATGTFKVKRR